MLQFMTTAGGVAMILFGIRFLRKGLDRLFGERLVYWMRQLADSRPKAFLSGIGVSVLAPSSTTVSILAVQAVQTGHLSARQMFAFMLGADIGLTVMVLLISLQLDTYAPILVLIGVVLFQFTRTTRSRGIGQVVLALGLIFMAISVIKTAATMHRPSQDFLQLINAASHYPVILALIAAALSVAMQSSTATIGLVIGLGVAQQVNLPVAVAVVVGANVGIAVNALVVGWRQVESRRLGLANLLAKTAVAIGVLLALPWVLRAVSTLPLGLEKQTAAAHTGFNVLTAIIFLPLVGPVSRLATRLVPQEAETPAVFGPRYLHDAPADSLSLALSQSARETLHMSEVVRDMLDGLWKALHARDPRLIHHVQARDDQLDLLDTEITRFLTQRVAVEDNSDDSGEVMRQLRYINELETIGDIIDKNLGDLARKYVSTNNRFSDEIWAELDAFCGKVRENILIAENAFNTRDAILKERLLRHNKRLAECERELRDHHFRRLRNGANQSYESSAIYLDLLTHLKRINSCVTHVAYTIVPNHGEDRMAYAPQPV